MKREHLAIFLAISLLFLTACKTQEQTVTGKAFIGGIEGLQIGFEPLSIKEGGMYTVFDDEEFALELTMKNKGEEMIKKGDITVELVGLAREDFSGISAWEKKSEKDLEKISEFNPLGGEESLKFADKAKYKGTVKGAIDLTWNVNYKYKYKTYLIMDNVCFKENLQDKRVCEVQEAKTFSVSSAPVTITAVKEDTAGKGLIALLIDVENKGGGDITLAGKEFDKRFDQISFKIDEPNKWECKSGGSENEAKLYKDTNKATIRCKLKAPLKEKELYTKPVKMEFEYVYQNLIKENLRVKESQK